MRMEVVKTAISNIRRISCRMHKHLRVYVCVCFYFNRANSRGFPVSLLRRGNNKGCSEIIPSSPLLQLSISARQ